MLPDFSLPLVCNNFNQLLKKKKIPVDSDPDPAQKYAEFGSGSFPSPKKEMVTSMWSL